MDYHRFCRSFYSSSLRRVDGDIEHMLTFMRDVHRYTARQLGDERMWPLSMPCYIAPGQDIELAQYGTSNVGRLKTLYREGLKNRYGALMQTISGVHYNFSLPMAFWQAKCGVEDVESGKEAISAGYFRSIRNYYRFWLGDPLSVRRLAGDLLLVPARETNDAAF
ncbi:glutamate--cysteine ligase [Klebsiella variicola]|uniref:Glutamate--cysteine ligase n=1 Tax=Klebsiella variicola TaxID=244366 RepID=A0A7H4MQX1_KLEVA|nr:glutamate--cysteine ligase [Klebsiella variicola]